MNKKTNLLLFLSIFLLTLFSFLWRKVNFKPHSQRTEQSQKSPLGNKRIPNFRRAKKIARKFYTYSSFSSFYCGCPFRGSRVMLNKCPLPQQVKEHTRSQKIEWEHIVPASRFGKKFPAWKQGHPKCQNKKGTPFKGRRCARLSSQKFRFMEADLYNLVPVVGQVNALRSNHPLGKVTQLESKLGKCGTKISKNKILPRKEARGLVARIYLYMHKSYPGYKIINKKNKKLISRWSEENPPTAFEKARNLYIQRMQGNQFVYE